MSAPTTAVDRAERPLLAGLLAAGWVSVIELGLVGARFAPGAVPSVWLGAALFALLVPVGSLVAWVALRLVGGRRRPWPGATLLVVSAALHGVDALAYVRLYASLHALLGTLVALTAAVGAACLVPARLRLEPERRRTLVLGAGLAAWLVLLVGCVGIVTHRPGLRFFAVERTTLLAHALVGLGRVAPILRPAAETGAAVDAAALASLRPSPLERPSGRARGANVLLITVDSLRSDALAQTPRLQALAAQGTRFERAYAPSCWTIDSMASVLAAKRPSRLRKTWVSVDTSLAVQAHADDDPSVLDPRNWKKLTPVPLGDPSPTLPRWLRDAGYRTATVAAYVFYMAAAGVTDDFELVDDSVYREHNVDNLGVTSVPMTERALAFLRGRDRAKPYFLWLHYMDAHAPYVAQDRGAEGGDDRARYESELRLVDRELGRLLDELVREGSFDDTMIVVHADHGEEFRDHGGQYHATTVYDETLHVPLVVKPPRRAQAPHDQVVAAPVSLVDLTPTLLDALGLAAAAPLDGRSLWPAILGEPWPPRPVIGECDRFGFHRRALVDGNLKLLVDKATSTFELYDLAADPRETRNLVEELPEAFVRLATLLAATEASR